MAGSSPESILIALHISSKWKEQTPEKWICPLWKDDIPNILEPQKPAVYSIKPAIEWTMIKIEVSRYAKIQIYRHPFSPKNRKDVYKSHRKSTPFLSQFVKPRFPKILRRHCNPELTICVEIYEKRFRKKWNPWRISHIYYGNSASSAVLLRKINGFGFRSSRILRIIPFAFPSLTSVLNGSWGILTFINIFILYPPFIIDI